MEIDAAVADLAVRQHGVVGTRQIRELGGNRHAINHRVATGRWERPSSRVIAVAGAPHTAERRLMTAVVQAGPTALASHESAAWLWGLPGFAATDVVLRGRPHGATAAHGHRPTLVLAHHRVEVRGIPCTSLPRTIFDLAGMLPLGRMARLVDTVVTRSPSMLSVLHETLPELSCQGRAGIRNMRLLLDERPPGSTVPASGNEARFEAICRNAGFPGFERQIDVGGHSWLGRCDYRRLDVKLIVEIDSELHHTSVTDRANDAARDAAMLAAGWRKVHRIWDDDLWHHSYLVVDALRRVLHELGA